MTTKFDALMSDPEFRKEFAVEGAIADASQIICDLLDRKNMNKADLARLLQKTPAYVSQLLSGKTNMTVRTLAEVAHALGFKIEINVGDIEGAVVDISASAEEGSADGTNPDRNAELKYHFRSRLLRHPPKYSYRMPSEEKCVSISDLGKFGERSEDVA